ncbi:MAG: FAD-binding protein [Halanaerobiaceae bacterium]
MSTRIGIIGAGPAGLSAALAAAEKDVSVTLWEKGNIGDNINCAEGFFDIRKMLSCPRSGVQFAVNKMIVQVKEEYMFDVSEMNLWMIDRQKWQKSLAEEARQKGVRIYENQKKCPDDLDDLKKDFDYIFDASGIPSVTSLKYDFRNIYSKDALYTAQYRVKGDFSKYKNAIKVVLLPEEKGYGWVFPRGKDEANVGVGLFKFTTGKSPGRELELALENFYAEEKSDDFLITSKTGGICPNVLPQPIIYDNIVLTGDAAGLTSPLHGGGIDLAVLSGKLASDLVAGSSINLYSQKLKEVIEDKKNVENAIKKFILGSNREIIDKFVRIMSDKFNSGQLPDLFDKKVLSLLSVIPRFLNV